MMLLTILFLVSVGALGAGFALLLLRYRALSVPTRPRIEPLSLMSVSEIDRLLLWRLDGEATDNGFVKRMDFRTRVVRPAFFRVYDGPYATRLFLIFVKNGERRGYRVYYELQSHFLDGRSLTTRNARLPNAFPPPSFDQTHELPAIVSLRVLLARHLEKLAKERARGCETVPIKSQNAIAMFEHRFQAHMRELVQAGYLRIGRSAYRPTGRTLFARR